MQSKMQVSSRACKYALQPTEQQPPPGTVALRNSLEIVTNFIITKASREGGKEVEQTVTQMHDLEFKTEPLKVSMHHLKLGKTLYVWEHN